MSEGTYRIKPLEWDEQNQAECIAGTYSLYAWWDEDEDDEGDAPDCVMWAWEFEGFHDTGQSEYAFSKKEHAIADAQSHFDALIASCLDPA